MRRLAIALLLFTATACGLAFSPGDYREPNEAAPNPSPDGSAIDGDGGSRPAEDGGPIDAGPTRTRIALFAGRRDALPGETGTQVTIAETMLTSIDSDGTLGPIAFDAPPPSATLWTHAALAGGTIYLHTSTALAHAPFTDRVSGAWAVSPIPAAPSAGVKGWMLDAHGLLSGRASAADSNPQAWSAAFVDGGVAPWLNLGAKTAVARGNTRLVRAGDHVYIVGGDTPALTNEDDPIPSHSEVEVAKLGADGEPSDFHTTTSLPTFDGGAYATFDPIAVASADHVYLLGGLTTSSAASLSDVTCAAKIKDAATGDLEPWSLLPKLPQPMNGFAAVVTPAWLVVFGGQTGSGSAAKASASILRLAIHADGTFGGSWETAGELPGGRSSIVGVTY